MESEASQPAPDPSLPRTLVNLPPEILLIILPFLDTSDILHVRQTCRTLCKTTYERAIWMALLHEQATYLPLPPELLRIYRQEDKHLHAYSASTVESIVVKAQRTANAWLRPRTGRPLKLKKEAVGATLMGLKMILDRWLVALYFEGVVHVYDTQPEEESALDTPTKDVPILRASFVLENSCTSYAISIDPSGETLFLAISRSQAPHMIEILEINFKHLPPGRIFSEDAFKLTRIIPLPSYKNIQALDIVERLIVFSTPGVVEIMRWDEDYNPVELDTRLRRMIRVRPEDLEGLFNGVVAVNFIGSYLLVFKTRSLEIYEYTSSDKPPMPALKHPFSMTFREVSFSECSVSRNPVSETETHEVSIFAYDVIQGLFHYTVRLSIPLPSSSAASELPPVLEVRLTGVYPLALGIVHPHPSLASSINVTYSANFSPSTTFTLTHAGPDGSPSTITRHERDGNSDYSSRGFLSTHCLGLQGKRAIWVERKRSSTVREVQVWAREPPSVAPAYVSGRLDGRGDGVGASSTVEMRRRVVYSLNSYDLRDDITHCTFGEVNGTIALGHRSGEISIMKVNDVAGYSLDM